MVATQAPAWVTQLVGYIRQEFRARGLQDDEQQAPPERTTTDRYQYSCRFLKELREPWRGELFALARTHAEKTLSNSQSETGDTAAYKYYGVSVLVDCPTHWGISIRLN